MKDPLVIKRRGKPIDLEGLWSPNPGFLVGGGPSLNDFNLDRLRERGVVSLAVNQCAAKAPVKAWVFSDSHWKFYHGMYIDPAMMTFAPTYKATRWPHAKTELGFQMFQHRMNLCPNTFTYDRTGMFWPETFFTDEFAHWGPSGKQPKDKPFPNAEKPFSGFLCTMLIGIRLLHYLGCRRLYMIGIDFDGRDGKCYGFPEEKSSNGRWERRYWKEEFLLQSLIPEMEKVGLEMFNCNSYSKCRVFPHVPFDDAVNDCKGSIPPEPFDTYGWYNMKENERQCKQNPKFVPKHYEKY